MAEPGTTAKARVAVIFGGPGPEHEVSLASAGSVIGQMNQLGWDVLAVGVSKDGRWLVGPGALDRLLAEADPALLPLGSAAAADPDQPQLTAELFTGPPPPSIFTGYDLAFPVCHGRWGEDGTLQGLLIAYGLQVVGCGVTASAVCFDKQLAKTVLAAAGLPVARGAQLRRRDWFDGRDAALKTALDHVGPGPWFVKPTRGGSSIGASGAATRTDLPGAIEEALRWDDSALIEEHIPHREWLVGVVGRDELVVSAPLEVVRPGERLDYQEKYRLGRLRFEPPAGPVQLLGPARRLAEAAFRALGCEVYSRVDLFLDTRTDRLLVNEVNTLPGMTGQSVFGRLMAGTGLPYPALLETLCRLAEEIR